MSLTILQKKDLNHFIERLLAQYRVAGPTRKNGGTAFDLIEDSADLQLDYATTILPPKKYLLPPQETLFEFNKDEDGVVHPPKPDQPTVIFGVHTCDLHAIQLLDTVFSNGHPDSIYMERRKSTLIVSVECLTPYDEHSFCKSMGTLSADEGYDLHLTDLGSSFVVDIGTQKGEDLLSDYSWPRPERKISRFASVSSSRNTSVAGRTTCKLVTTSSRPCLSRLPYSSKAPARTPGTPSALSANATRSRGVARSAAMRPNRRSRSPRRAKASRNAARVSGCSTNQATAACRASASARRRSGARNQRRSMREPMAVAAAATNAVYVADTVNHRVRAVKGSLGSTTLTVAKDGAGSGTATYVMSKGSAPFDRGVELFDSTIGWGFANRLMKEQYGIDPMGVTAENVAGQFGVSREDQDAFALESQLRAARAISVGFFSEEISPVVIPRRKGGDVTVDRDEHPRPDITRGRGWPA